MEVNHKTNTDIFAHILNVYTTTGEIPNTLEIGSVEVAKLIIESLLFRFLGSSISVIIKE